MAIYLDANALWSWRTFTESDRLAVSIVAHQLGQEVLIPWIAAREAEEEYRRSLQNARSDLDRARSTLERRFDSSFDLTLTPEPKIDHHVSTWRERLEEFAAILPMEDCDARTALEREITGAAPAAPRDPRKPGRGGRDAALWLSIARHHSSAREEGHLLSTDKVFANGDGGLNETLRSDLGDSAYQMRVYPDLTTFLEQLGRTAQGREVTLDELDQLATSAVKDSLTEAREMALAVWGDLKPGWYYHTIVSGAHPVGIAEQRRYEQGDDAVIVVSARWDLTLVCRTHKHNAPDHWLGIQDVQAKANVQLFLEERDGELQPATIIGRQVISEMYVFLWPDSETIDAYPKNELDAAQ